MVSVIFKMVLIFSIFDPFSFEMTNANVFPLRICLTADVLNILLQSQMFIFFCFWEEKSL